MYKPAILSDTCYYVQMVLKTRMICPKSWKCLFLLSEHDIKFQQEHITLNTEIIEQVTSPLIDEKDELFYIFSNLKTFISENELGNVGSVINDIEGVFLYNVVLPMRFERIIKPLVYRTMSNIEKLNELRKDLKKSLIKYSKKLDIIDWFSQEKFGYADITISSAIAVLDYLGEIPWQLEELKQLYHWYLKIKSKTTFKPILNESCPGLKPFFKFTQIDF